MKYKNQNCPPSLFNFRSLRTWMFFLLAALPSASSNAAETVPATKPNIVVILIDDMGYGDIGPFGFTKAKTPALDRMASEGLKLTSFYAAPICSASRAQILTGCYAPRVSVPSIFVPGDSLGLNPEENTVADLLKQKGYATMCIGKWHLGDQPEFLPTRQGFDHYYGIPYSNDMLRPTVDTGERVVPLLRDEKVEVLWKSEDQNQMTRLYTEEAVKFIQTNKNSPFFLYFAHNAVHVPVHVGPDFVGKSGKGRYADWVMETDWSVGRVLDTLREQKLDKNTLVIFTSDNGPWLIMGPDGGSAGPLRGGKMSTWEGGLREPTLAWWPGHVPAGAVADTVAGEIDLLPTFVALAGGTVPTDRKIDGADISPLLLGQTTEAAREAHFYYNGYDIEAVRSGPWKLALRPQGLRDNKKDMVSEPGLRLYNLDKDIGEKEDVSKENPEIVKRLEALATGMASSLCDGSSNGPGIRPPGRVKNPKPLYPMGAEGNQGH